MSRKEKLFVTSLAIVCLGLTLAQIFSLHAQNGNVGSTPTPVTVFSQFPLTPITATAAVANATTLTIPAPTQSGFFNYVCYLAMEGGNNNTATVVTNAAGSSTNFNAWANKTSVPSLASNDTGILTYINMAPPGCPKSTSPTTATTFVSPNSAAEAYTWYAVYFQAP